MILLVIVLGGCASGGASQSDTVGGAEGSTITTGDGEPEEPSADDAGEWSADLDGAGVCAAASTAGIETGVGLALSEDPVPVDSRDTATCLLTFEDGSIAEVVVWPETAWEGRSPQEAFSYRYEVNSGPSDATVSGLDGVGEEGALFGGASSAVLVRTEGRVFSIRSSTLGENQLTELARVFADGL